MKIEINKELSVEQKARRYDEAIKLVNSKWHYKNQPCLIDVSELFPELKDEDETIRKELIDFVKSRLAGFPECDRFIAWLEKQSGTNIFDVPEISIKDAVEVTSRMQYIEDDMKPIAEFILNHANWNLHKDEWNQPTLTVPLFRVLDALIQRGKPYSEKCTNVEKQGGQTLIMANSPQLGEQKTAKNIVETWKDMRLEVYQQASGNRHEPNYSDDTTKMFSLNDIDEIIEKMSEEQQKGEQKVSYTTLVETGNGNIKALVTEEIPIDKVEPKFHEGEWIISNNNKSIYQVIEVKRGIYVVRDNADNKEYHIGIESCERTGRLWTIKDAKDGDLIYVSTEEKGIQAIFHEYKNDTIFFHCYLCGDFVQGGYMPIGSVELVYPLQKTHHKRFFEKMHVAGYTFDFESKELKEIEQKPAWSEVDKDFMYDTLSNLTELKDRYGEGYGNVGKCIDWLKSLKDRVQTLAKIEKGIK